MKQHFPPPALHPKIPPLSLACRTGNLLFVSGTPGYDADMRLDRSFTVQFETAIDNFREAIELGGGSLAGIVRINLFLTRAADIAEMNRIYARAFGPAPYPARTTVIVAGLPDPDMLVELDCVVELPE